MHMITPRPPGVNDPPDLVEFATKLGKRQFSPIADAHRMALTAWRFQCGRWTLWSFAYGRLETEFVIHFLIGWDEARNAYAATILEWQRDRKRRGLCAANYL